MFRRYHHGHSLGLGILIGLLLTQHPFALAALAFVAGAALSWACTTGWRLAQTLRGAFEAWRDVSRARQQRILARPVRKPRPAGGPGDLPEGY